MADISIGELARRSGVKVATIRYYEQAGLAPVPVRTDGRQRRYGPAAVGRLNFIRNARELGFEVSAVRELLALSEQPQPSLRRGGKHRDALDFLADTVTYGLSFAVIGATLRTRARAAMFKGLSLSLMALWVLGSTIYQTLILGLPKAEVMGVVGLLALAANLASVLLLQPYKDGDANVRSVWLCSRNDAIGNIIVMVAAFAVWATATAWPDLLVAAIMAGIFLTSSVQILRQAWSEYREGSRAPKASLVHNARAPITLRPTS